MFDMPSRASSANLALLRGQIVAGVEDASVHVLACRPKLTRGALGERLHTDRHEMAMGDAELLARVRPPILATQSLPVDEIRASELGTQTGAAEPLDRLTKQELGCLALTQ